MDTDWLRPFFESLLWVLLEFCHLIGRVLNPTNLGNPAFSVSQRYGVFRVPFVPLIRLCVGTSKKLDTMKRLCYFSVFFDVTRFQSDVGITPLLSYTLPYKNPCVTAQHIAVRTWASGNSTLLMHALRWRPSRLGYFAINRLFQSCYVWLDVSISQPLSFPSG